MNVPAGSGVWTRARTTDDALSLLEEERQRTEITESVSARLVAHLRLERVRQLPKPTQLALFLGFTIVLMGVVKLIA